MDWETFKEELKKLPLKERLVELQILLKNVQDKSLKSLIEKEIKKVTVEIEKQREWKGGGEITFGGGRIEVEDDRRPARLEEVVEAEPIPAKRPEEDVAKISYAAGGSYLSGYLRGYERQREGELEERIPWEPKTEKEKMIDYSGSLPAPQTEDLRSEKGESMLGKTESEKKEAYERGKK